MTSKTGKKGKSALNPKQRMFVSEYLLDLNATQAAIRAGYSEKTANEQAARMLAKASIQEAIRKKREKREMKLDISAEKVLQELACIAFADIRKAVKWKNGPSVSFDGTQSMRIESSVMLVPSDELDEDIAAAISEVSQTNTGIKIKFHDKQAALALLAKHFGLTPELMKHSGTVGLKRVPDDYTDEELANALES